MANVRLVVQRKVLSCLLTCCLPACLQGGTCWRRNPCCCSSGASVAACWPRWSPCWQRAAAASWLAASCLRRACCSCCLTLAFCWTCSAGAAPSAPGATPPPAAPPPQRWPPGGGRWHSWNLPSVGGSTRLTGPPTSRTCMATRSGQRRAARCDTRLCLSGPVSAKCSSVQAGRQAACGLWSTTQSVASA